MELSVIIPVYNGENFLEECLVSMTHQNFCEGKHEVIIVDDGSTDSTLEIASQYCNNYSFFKILKGEHRGVSAARNLGIQNSRGDYITFMDADDFFADFSYLPLIRIMQENELDLIKYEYTSNKNELQTLNLNFKEWTFCNNYCPTSVWSAIYRKDIIISKGISFNENQAVYEDYIFNFKYSYAVEKGCALISQRPYYYRTNLNSVSRNLKNRNENIRINALKKGFDGLFIAMQEIQTYTQEKQYKKDNFYYGAIAACMQSYLLFSVYLKESPYKTIHALNSIGLSLHSLRVKNIEGLTKREKIKSELMYLMRFRVVFILFSFMYKILK